MMTKPVYRYNHKLKQWDELYRIDCIPVRAGLIVAKQGDIEIIEPEAKYKRRAMMIKVGNLLGFAICVTILILTLGAR